MLLFICYFVLAIVFLCVTIKMTGLTAKEFWSHRWMWLVGGFAALGMLEVLTLTVSAVFALAAHV